MLDDLGSLLRESPAPSMFDQYIMTGTVKGRFEDYIPPSLHAEFKTIAATPKIQLLRWFLTCAKLEIHKGNEPFWKGVLLILKNGKVTVVAEKMQINSTAETIPQFAPTFTVSIPNSENEASHCVVYFAGSDMENLFEAKARNVLPDPDGKRSINLGDRYKRKFENQLSLIVGSQTVEEEREIGYIGVRTRKSPDKPDPAETEGFTTLGTSYSVLSV